MTAGDGEHWPDEPAPGGSLVGTRPGSDIAGTVRTEYPVTMAQVRDLSITALEGGIGYWSVLTRGDYQHDVRFWLSPADEQVTSWSEVVEGFDCAELEVTPGVICQGLELLPDYSTRLWRYFEDDNTDADVADAVIQLGLFGEVVFS